MEEVFLDLLRVAQQSLSDLEELDDSERLTSAGYRRLDKVKAVVRQAELLVTDKLKQTNQMKNPPTGHKG